MKVGEQITLENITSVPDAFSKIARATKGGLWEWFEREMAYRNLSTPAGCERWWSAGQGCCVVGSTASATCAVPRREPRDPRRCTREWPRPRGAGGTPAVERCRRAGTTSRGSPSRPRWSSWGRLRTIPGRSSAGTSTRRTCRWERARIEWCKVYKGYLLIIAIQTNYSLALNSATQQNISNKVYISSGFLTELDMYTFLKHARSVEGN